MVDEKKKKKTPEFNSATSCILKYPAKFFCRFFFKFFSHTSLFAHRALCMQMQRPDFQDQAT